MQSDVTVTMNLDWNLLRRQKQSLLDVISKSENKIEADHLEGILLVVDAIQDRGARSVGEKEVFGD